MNKKKRIMEIGRLKHAESMNSGGIEAPAVESFLDPSSVAEVWPERVAKNEVFKQQIEARKKLNDNLTAVLDSIPNPLMTIAEAVKENCVKERQVEELYESLSDLLEDKEYVRALLYLPFELLPDKNWDIADEKLQKAASRFKAVYMQAWKRLLSVQDVRANFVDGDVLETDKRVGDLPRVVKAAHLIPILVEKGMIDVQDVISLMEETPDPLLKDSIVDTMPVLDDLELIAEDEIRLMEESTDKQTRDMAEIIVSGREEASRPETGQGVRTLSEVEQKLSLFHVELESDDYGDLSERRIIWLKQSKTQAMVESLAEEFSLNITEGQISEENESEFQSPDASNLSKQVLIEGVRKAVESGAEKDLDNSKKIYDKFKEILLNLWEDDDPGIKASLAKTFRHFYELELADEEMLARLEILLPKLAGPFSENLKLMPGEMREIKRMVAGIENDPELSRLIYPAALVYGSKLKGYGEQSSDIDIAVFVKPGTPQNESEKLREQLEKHFSYGILQGRVVEFWLNEKDDDLEVQDFPYSTDPRGGKTWLHVLFGAAWTGDKEIVKVLQQRLLTPYLFETSEEMYGRNIRGIYLEEMERDTLQYRLMHKGHERFFPSYGGMDTVHSAGIDGDSTFWDSGYRRTATKLFASRIFLPKIPK